MNPFQSCRARRRLLLTAVGLSAAVAATPGTAFAAFGVSKLTLNTKNGRENYQYTAGNTVYAAGTVDVADSATPVRRYRFVFRGPDGGTRGATACAKTNSGGTASGTYTIQGTDPISTSAMWRAVLEQYKDTACTIVEKTASLPFAVAQANAYASSALTTSQSYFGAGATAYLRLAGLTPGSGDWSTTWRRPNGATACANAVGGDRPDSDANGALPAFAAGFLQYQPGATGDAWNLQASYDGTCPAATTQGAWKLLVERDATHFVTLTAFTVDPTAPTSSSTSANYSGTNTFTVAYTASDTGGSGLGAVDLYAKGPGEMGYTKAATDSSPAASGSFSYMAPGGDGTYSFYTVATDKAGNAEATPSAADSTTLVDSVAPSSDAASPTFSTTSDFAVSYTATDLGSGATGLAKVDLFAKGPSDSTYAKVATDSAPAAFGSFSYTAAQGNGSYSFYTVAADPAGNVEPAPASPDATTAVGVDSTPPASAATSAQYSTSGSLTVSYTASDPGSEASGLAKVELYAKGPGDAGYAKVATDSTPGTSGSFPYTASAGDGTYSFFTVATDSAGNAEPSLESPDSSTVVDTAAPSSVASSPSSSSTGITVSYTAAEPGTAASGLATVELYAKGPGDGDYAKAATDTAPGGSGSFAYTATQGTGTYGFYTVATDRAGNAEAPPGGPDGTTTYGPPPSPTLYVARNDPSCTDTGSGTATRPFCTIKPAATRVTAGETVRVSSGTYNEMVTVASSGTPSGPINFVAAPGEEVTVAGGGSGFDILSKSHVTVQGFTVTGTTGDGIVVKDSSRITLRGNRVTNSGQPVLGQSSKGIRVEASTDSVIANNTVDHNTNYGIYLSAGSTRNEVVGNEVFGNARQYERAGSGIRVYMSTGNMISSNVSRDNEDSGIELVNAAHDNLVVNNVTYGNGDHGIDVTGGSLRARLIGNSVYNNLTSGMNIEGGSTGGSVINNIGVDNAINSPRGTGNIRVDSTSTTGALVDYNVVWQRTAGRNYEWASLGYNTIAQMQAATGQEAHGIQADPRWASPSTGDFALMTGSPAIDSADSGASGQLSVDAEERARLDDPGTVNSGVGPRAYDDRGALEYKPANRPPVPALTVSPGSGVVDLGVTADASASVDTDGLDPIASYTFDWGDGSATTGPQDAPTAAHTYRAAGTYTVTVTVTDTAGASADAQSTVTVTDDPPQAALALTPSSGGAPLDVAADASRSTDTDGTPIASFRFDWGDGSDVTGPQVGATARHTYDSPGTYTVTVAVNDTAGQTSHATATVTVHGGNVPPTAALSVTPASGVVDLDVTADASASTDPDDGIASYSFAWGDGTAASGPQATATATHTYRAAGTYTVTVTVTDAGGGASAATSRVTVQDMPPAARLSVTPASGLAPLDVTADASASTDTDGTPIATYSFDWGDGTAVSGPQDAAEATHTYASGGTYTVTVTVKDTAGQSSKATAQVSARRNLVGNPGFENDLTGWNSSGSSAGVTVTRVSGGHAGNWAAKLSNTGTAAATCTLNDSPDWAKATSAGSYTGAIWVRSDTAGATLKVRFTEYSTGVKVGTAITQVPLTASWQKVTLSYTAVSPGSTLDFNAYVTSAAPGTCFYADDVSIDLN